MNYDEEKKDTLIIEKKVVGRLGGGLLLLFFMVFSTGYYVGKKKAAKELLTHIDKTSFADHVTFALGKMHTSSDEQEFEDKPSALDSQPGETESVSSIIHKAELYGGTAKQVNSFIDRLAQHDLRVESRKRTGKTPKGRTITWYQAVTTGFQTKEELKAFINAIKKHERISEKYVEISS